MSIRKRYSIGFGFLALSIIAAVAIAQVRPRSPIFGADTQVTNLRVIESTTTDDLTITGTCTGCGGGSPPGGMSGEVQFNDAGAFGGVPFVYDAMNESLTFTESTTITIDALNGVINTPVIEVDQEINAVGGDLLLNVAGAAEVNDLTITGTCTGCGGAMTAGTFEAVWDTACATSPSQTINYVTDGEFVMLQPIDNVSCTGDSTNFLATTALPAEIRPVSRRVAGIFEAVDNAVETGACWLLEPTGNIQAIDIGTTENWCADSSTTNWQATGARSLSGLTAGGITYMISDVP